jgi:cell division septum initiation protein DivIVA
MEAHENDNNPNQVEEGDEGHAYEGINHDLLDDLIQSFNDLQERIEELEEELEALVGQQEEDSDSGSDSESDGSSNEGSAVEAVNQRPTGLGWDRPYLGMMPQRSLFGNSPYSEMNYNNAKRMWDETKKKQEAYDKKEEEARRNKFKGMMGAGYVTPPLGKPLPFF